MNWSDFENEFFQWLLNFPKDVVVVMIGLSRTGKCWKDANPMGHHDHTVECRNLVPLRILDPSMTAIAGVWILKTLPI